MCAAQYIYTETVTKPETAFPHFREDRHKDNWIPAFAGMTEDDKQFCYNMPAAE